MSYKKIKCTTVNDGLSGLALLKRKSFDVILLDLNMPEFSGYDVLNELIKENKIKELKIIILTATMLNETKIKELKKMGVYSVEKKPTRIQFLLDVMS